MEDHDTDYSIATLPPQKPVTAVIMQRWEQHGWGGKRDKARVQLHTCRRVNAQPRVQQGASGHSILQQDMPIGSDEDEDGRQHKIKFSPLVFLDLLLSVGFWSLYLMGRSSTRPEEKCS